MAKLIAYKEASGNLVLLTVAPKERVGLVLPEVLLLDDDAYLEFIKAKDVPPDATDITIVDSADVPTDRTHRDCWNLSGSKVQVDAAKLQAKQDAADAKQAKQDAVLSKLKISKTDLQELLDSQ